jgi:hypothetical protein
MGMNPSLLVSNSSFQVKVKFSLCLNNYEPVHEDVWGSEGIAPSFFTLALVGDEWSVYAPRHFTPPKWVRKLSTHWRGGWACPKACMDNVEK